MLSLFVGLALGIVLAPPAESAGPRLSRRPRNAQGSNNCGTAPGLAPVTQPHLDYCGGRVLAQAQLVAVLWGPPDPLAPTPSCSGTFQDCLDAWYQAFVQSPQFDWIDEYQTTLPAHDGDAGTGQHISRATYYGSVVITPANTNAVVGEVEVETEIVAQIQAGKLPAPGASDETLYEVHFPLGVDPSDTCAVACGDFCAYHDSWHSNILNTTGIIAILPSHMPPGYPGGRNCALCGNRTDWFANLGGSISHETFESITDPDVGLSGGLVECAAPVGWYDTSPSDDVSVHGEIGDLCEGLPDGTNRITEVSFAQADGGVYTVQREWSNAFSACIGAASGAFGVAGPAGALLDEPGGNATFTIATHASPSATGPVALKLAAHGLPSTGVTATFTPSVLDASGTSTLTLAVAADAPRTSFAFGITGDSGDALAQTVLTVNAPDFSAAATPLSLGLTAGGPPAVVNLTTQALSGAQRGFALSTAGVTGVVAAPATGQLGTPLAVSLSALAGAPSISGTLLLDVTSGGVLHPLPIQVTLAGDDAALSAPAGLKVAQGGSVQFTVSSSTRAGAPQLLTLTATNTPVGARVSFSPLQITSGETSTATLSVADGQALGPISITLVGSGPLAQTTLNLPVTVVAASGCASLDPTALLALLGLAVLARRRC